LAQSFLSRLIPNSNNTLIVIGDTGGAIFIAIEAALIAIYGGTDNKAGNAAVVGMLFGFITTLVQYSKATLKRY
jgi:hypothetical protein